MSEFTREDYDLMAEAMMLGLKELDPAKRTKAGMLINNLRMMSRGLDTLTHEEFNELMKEHAVELDRTSPCGSFDGLLEQMKNHVRHTGERVELVPADEPLHLRLGWYDMHSDQSWTIRIADMRLWINGLDKDQHETAARAMMTHEGKIRFATSLTEQVNSVLS
jgi:hypothetical protein